MDAQFIVFYSTRSEKLSRLSAVGSVLIRDDLR
jgi:hypothetical protein